VSVVQSYNLFETGGVDQPKVILNNKQYAPILPLRFPIQFFPFNFVMEVSLLLDFLFNINYNVLIEINEYTLEGIRITIPQFKAPQISLPPLIPPSEQLSKCYFGESRFNECYYDPGFTINKVRDYLRSAINKVSRNMSVPNFLSGLDYPEWFQHYANRILNTAIQTIEKTMILDLALFDFSEFSPEREDGNTYLPFQWLTTNPELNQQFEYPEYIFVDDLMWGTVLDWMYLDLSIFTSHEKSILGEPYAQFMDAVIDAIMTNYNPFKTATKLAFTDPSIPSIPIPPSLSELFAEAFPQIMENAPFAPLTARAERWGRAMDLIKTIRRTVRNMLMNVVANPIMINAYEDASVEYCMAFHHNHNRTRYLAWKGIGLETFNKAWLSKWVGMGLDPNILNNLLNILSTVCPKPIAGFKGVDSPLANQ